MRPVAVFLGALLLLMVLPGIVIASDPPPALGPGFYDDTLPLIEYGGSWSMLSASQYFQGTLQLANTVGSSVRVTVWGDGVGLYATHGPNGGTQHQLCVQSGDDPLCTTIDQYAPSTAYQVRTEISGFGPGVHHITITNGGGNLTLDALHVLPPVPEPLDPNAITVNVEIDDLPAPAWMVLEGDGEEGQLYAVDYSLRPSDTAIIILLAGVLMSNLITLVYSMWKAR